MKTLYLLRHSKSSRDFSELADFDRPLNERGYSDAHQMGKFLFERDIKLDLLISSPAIRAISTALIFSLHLKYPVEEIQLNKSLYESSVKHYLQCISEVSDNSDIMLVGHNETISETAQKLSTQRILEMKTCAVIALEFDIKAWKEISNSKGSLVFHFDPNSIKDV